MAANAGTAISVLQQPSPSVASGASAGKNSSASQVSMVNSIVSGNGANCAGFAGLQGPILVDGGHNDQFPGSGCNPSIVAADPQLDSMLVPAPGNAALSGGDNAVCAGPQVGNSDVWAQYRPRGANCSIGAIEGGMEMLVLQQNPGTVIPVRTGDFSITVDPLSRTIAGSTATAQYTVKVTATGGFAAPVTFGVSNVPSGTSAGFNPPSGSASVLTITNGPLVTPGTYTLAIGGTSGALSHSVSATLIVAASTN